MTFRKELSSTRDYQLFDSGLSPERFNTLRWLSQRFWAPRSNTMPFTEYVLSSSYVMGRDSDHGDRGTSVTFPTKSGDFTIGTVKGFKVSLYPGIYIVEAGGSQPGTRMGNTRWKLRGPRYWKWKRQM